MPKDMSPVKHVSTDDKPNRNNLAVIHEVSVDLKWFSMTSQQEDGLERVMRHH